MGGGKKQQDVKSVVLKRLYGVQPETGEKMKGMLQKECNTLYRQGGKPPKLTVKDNLFIPVKYLREYRKRERIGAEYGVGKGRVSGTVRWVEDRLKQVPDFKVHGKKVLAGTPQEIPYIEVDESENPIQGPKKNKKGGLGARRSDLP
jgi:hypothetical protein